MKTTQHPWTATAERAWRDCDDRPLTLDEKIALVCEAITKMYLQRDGFRSTTIEWLSSRCPLSPRSFGATCRHHMDAINELLGERLRYEKGRYHASGRGAFGRLGGGAPPGRYHGPSLGGFKD